MPKVLNLHLDIGYTGAVYIGRDKGYRGRWGNPFIVGKDGTREEVVAKYRQWLRGQPELLVRVQQELRGKDLVCFCAPKSCHGDVLLEIANSSTLYLKFN